MSTPRLLIIGNSHTAALRAALAADPQRWQAVDIDCVSVRGALLRDTEVANGRLRPVTEDARSWFAELNAGHTDWDLTGYRAVAVVGLDFKPLTAVALARDGAWRALPSLAAEQDLARMPATLISEAAARAALEARLEGCDAARLVGKLRTELDCAVFLIPSPRLSHRGKWTDVPRFFGHGPAIKRGDASEIDRLWTAAARRVCHRIGARYVPQPRETVKDHIVTRRRYMADDEVTLVTAQGPRSGPDLTHANAAYGQIVLHRLTRKVLAMAAGSGDEIAAA